METKKWLSTKSREELKQTIGWGVPPVVSSKEVFSAHHPMIPKFYVPTWQLDMENRRNIIKVGPVRVLYLSILPFFSYSELWASGKSTMERSCQLLFEWKRLVSLVNNRPSIQIFYFVPYRAAECYTSSNVLQCRGLLQNTKEEVLAPLQVQQFYDDHGQLTQWLACTHCRSRTPRS